ncbi:hypothetical protein ACNKHO_15485 [Shigella flexneri]
MGFGSPNKAGQEAGDGAALGEEEVALAARTGPGSTRPLRSQKHLTRPDGP